MIFYKLNLTAQYTNFWSGATGVFTCANKSTYHTSHTGLQDEEIINKMSIERRNIQKHRKRNATPECLFALFQHFPFSHSGRYP